MELLFSLDWIVVLLLLVVFYLTYEFFKRRNLPPGPLSLPLFGSVGLYKQMAGVPPHIALSNVAQKYGSVFSVWVGPSLMVVLDGYEAIHQAFVKQCSDFNDRPSWITVFKGLREGNGILLSNGEEWHTIRTFCSTSMRDFGVKTVEIEPKILDEIEFMEEAIRKTNGQLTDFSQLLQMTSSNVIARIVVGQRFTYDDENLHNLLKGFDMVVKGSGPASPINFLPSCMHTLFRKEYKASLERDKVVRKTRELLRSTFERHESTFDPKHIRDFMDVYILSTKEDMTKSEKKYLSSGDVWQIIYDLFFAGSETTSTSLEWLLLYMIEKPEVQRKCQQTIADCVGDRPVRLSDRPQLTYIDAVLNEVLRLSNVTPTVARSNVREDISFNGYRIPKNVIILANIYSAHVDPTYWPEPFVFKPERFLDGDNNLIRKESFIPFSIGPRNCLGETLSRMKMFLIFTNLLQKFNLLRNADSANHDFSMNNEQYMTLRPSHYRLKAIPRTY